MPATIKTSADTTITTNEYRMIERPGSGSMTLNPPTLEKLHVISGVEDEDRVLATARLLLPPYYDSSIGRLWRQNIVSRRVGFKLYHLDVPYGRFQTQTLEYTFSGTTQGGTINQRCGEHIADYYASATVTPNHRGLIGVGKEGNVEGVDVIIPTIDLQVDIKYPVGHVTIEWVRQVAGITGRMNLLKFLSFQPGEVLYKGMTFRDGTHIETEVSHHFGVSFNQTDIKIAGIDGNIRRLGNDGAVIIGGTVIPDTNGETYPTTTVGKYGWDVGWIEYEGDPNATTAGQYKPRAFHVERVYQAATFSDVLGFGD